MPPIIDWTIVGELSFVVLALMQLVKSRTGDKSVRGSAIPWLSGIVAVACSLLWFLVNGQLVNIHDIHWAGLNWVNVYRAIAMGAIAAVGSIAMYNAQKAMPIPNLLPTTNEMAQQHLAENVSQQANDATVQTVAVATATTDESTTTATQITTTSDEGNAAKGSTSEKPSDGSEQELVG
jgi:hypothetical protein